MVPNSSSDTADAKPQDIMAHERPEESSKTYTELQYDAMVASKDAYISHMETGNMKEMTALKRKYDAAFVELKTAFTKEKSDILAKQSEVTRAAVVAEHSSSVNTINELKNRCEDLSRQHKALQTTFDETLAEKKSELASARSLTFRKSDEIGDLKEQHTRDLAKLKDDHTKEIKTLKRGVAVGSNSWIQLRFSFRGTSKKTKTCYKKWGDKLEDGVEEVLGKESVSAVRFDVMRGNACKFEKVDVKQPLDKQGIRDGDHITITKL